MECQQMLFGLSDFWTYKFLRILDMLLAFMTNKFIKTGKCC